MSEARERLEGALVHMRAEGLSGIIAASNGQNSFLESNAVYVFAGFRPIGETVLLIGKDGASVLLVTPAWDADRARRISSAQTVIGTDDLGAEIGEAARSCGIEAATARSVGLSMLGGSLAGAIETALGGAIAPADDLARDLARIRSSREQALVRKANDIAEAGYAALLKIARPGMREFELAAEIYTEMKRLGSEDNFLLMSASQHNLAVRAAGQRVLEEGDIILAEITPCYQGQFVQICRTAVIGEPRPVVREKFALLQTAMRSGQAAAVPGALVSEVTAAINRPFEEAGYGQYCKPPYMRVRGHGLGITSSRPGDIDANNHTQLEEGMVFVMHPNQYIPESGYLLCGETVVITPQGAKAFSDLTATLDVIGV